MDHTQDELLDNLHHAINTNDYLLLSITITQLVNLLGIEETKLICKHIEQQYHKETIL